MTRKAIQIPNKPVRVDEQRMQYLAEILKNRVPGLGFALFVFSFDEPGVANYISNATRATMQHMLQLTYDRLYERDIIGTLRRAEQAMNIAIRDVPPEKRITFENIRYRQWVHCIHLGGATKITEVRFFNHHGVLVGHPYEFVQYNRLIQYDEERTFNRPFLGSKLEKLWQWLHDRRCDIITFFIHKTF